MNLRSLVPLESIALHRTGMIPCDRAFLCAVQQASRCVVLTQAHDGGWGLAGHANTNDELVGLVRAQIARLKERQSAR